MDMGKFDKIFPILDNLKLVGLRPHVCLGGFFGGDQLPIPTRYKISAKSRGLYTCNVKVLAWGDQSLPSPPPRPRMFETDNSCLLIQKIVF